VGIEVTKGHEKFCIKIDVGFEVLGSIGVDVFLAQQKHEDFGDLDSIKFTTNALHLRPLEVALAIVTLVVTNFVRVEVRVLATC